MTSREPRLCQQLTMREFIDAVTYSADPIFCDLNRSPFAPVVSLRTLSQHCVTFVLN